MSAALALPVFWLLRERLRLLGDGETLVVSLGRGQSFHPHEPLTYILHAGLYRLARGLFQGLLATPADVAQATVALGSVAMGGAFVATAFHLARALAPRPDQSDAAPAEGDVRKTQRLTWSLFLVQGAIQLFFGYVENYSYGAAAIAFYLLAAIRFLDAEWPLLAAGVALVCALGLNLSAALLVPSFLVLLLLGMGRPGRRLGCARDAALTGVVLAAAQLFFASRQPGYSIARALREAFGLAIQGREDQAPFGYLLSREHAWGLLNEHLLIGPFAGLFFLPLLGCWLAHPWRFGGRGAFLVTAAGCALAGTWATGELNLGYARDWDLFAPYACVFTAAAVQLSLGGQTGIRGGRLLALALAASLFHTVPWVLLNASAERSLERFKALPLGLGRTEAAVGLWYLRHGNPLGARHWFERSIQAAPQNTLARYGLGVLLMDEGKYEEATGHLWAASRIRPDRDDFRLRLVDALVLSGRPEWAAPELRVLLDHDPGRAQYWACYGVVLEGQGRPDSARVAYGRAVELDPDQPIYAELAAGAGRPGAYERAVREDWDRLVVAGDRGQAGAPTERDRPSP